MQIVSATGTSRNREQSDRHTDISPAKLQYAANGVTKGALSEAEMPSFRI
ncbi:hypothetical protein HPS54_03460 [Prevotella sp. PCHR]|uniref:Uncharacterized protein n=1 Tax=Xylanibacter caecicola TaxID=2736294 RepID=A0ABX2B2Y8_9BACT|nr:hypothetical protein [Xylanibacter caecicola]NPE24585.1 hypothetical protein [Xylanibacter caecicola]